MVANLTLGKKKYADVQVEINSIRKKTEELHVQLMNLSRRDSEAFEAVLHSRRLPQSTPEEQESRAAALAAAEMGAAHVPLETAEACLEVLTLAEKVARIGNTNAVTDAGVAGLLAAAAAEGALLNVEINLKSLPSSPEQRKLTEDLQRLRQSITDAAGHCRETVSSVMNE
jgi:glutamate formiminotransferase/formiminotetrahydrofolate cyclodeaminase